MLAASTRVNLKEPAGPTKLTQWERAVPTKVSQLEPAGPTKLTRLEPVASIRIHRTSASSMHSAETIRLVETMTPTGGIGLTIYGYIGLKPLFGVTL